MGLCKCPRKKVTNLFCFEHRVNVCEHCLVANHPKCVVQSYLAWLQDSDYDPNCSLCGQNLADTNLDTVRLLCHHLFHWDCLDRWARSFPATTAPSGFRCPLCQTGIFPKPNQTSPVLDALRGHLESANWARAGLGLPLVPELAKAIIPPLNQTTNPPGSNPQQHQQQQFNQSKQLTGPSNNVHHSPTVGNGAPGNHDSHSISVNLTQADNMLGARKGGGGNESQTAPLLDPKDSDLAENKYKRRSPADWLRRFLNSRGIKSGSNPFRGYKKILFVILLILIAAITCITIATRAAQDHDVGDDTFLDPIGNPNIHVANSEEA